MVSLELGVKLKILSIRAKMWLLALCVVPSPHLWRQQRIQAPHDRLPSFLWQPGCQLGLRHRLQNGRLRVQRRFRHERWVVRAIQRVWLRLSRQILCCKRRHSAASGLPTEHRLIPHMLPKLELSRCLSVTPQLLETFVTEDCSMTCQCTSTGVVCTPKICQEDQVCKIYNSTRGCFRG